MDGAKQRGRTRAALNKTVSQPPVRVLSQVRIRVELFIRVERVPAQPSIDKEIVKGRTSRSKNITFQITSNTPSQADGRHAQTRGLLSSAESTRRVQGLLKSPRALSLSYPPRKHNER